MNILIIGIPDVTVVNAIKSSKYLEKLYLAAPVSFENIPNIDFTDFDDLIKKTKLLKIDITLTFDKDLINGGITEEFRRNKLNIISVNKKWLNLETSRISAKRLLNHYRINTPEFIKAPVEFPVVLKTDLPNYSYFAASLEDLIIKFEELEGQNFYTEEFLNGETFEFIHLWDGENLFTLPSEYNLSEVQKEKIKLYTTKMNFMLSDEKADFIGFFRSKLIWTRNDWYLIKFITGLDKYSHSFDFKQDFLFLLNCMLYRTLNEVE